MQITFDTKNPQDLHILNQLFKNLDLTAQPEVADNTGTTGSGLSTLSPEASGVSEPAAAEAAPAAPVKKERKAKPKLPPEVVTGKEYVPAEPQNDTAPAPAEAKPLTLDEVRAALQQFTAAKGVPAGIDLLKKFNAGRISELAEGDYASFVAECAA